MALVANGYTSYQISPNLWLGLGINAPFGLSVSFQDPWAGRNYRRRYDNKILQRESQHRLSHQRLDQHRRRRAGFSTRPSAQMLGVTPFPLDRRHSGRQRLGLRRDRGRYVHAVARTRRSDLGGARRSIRTSTARSLVPRGISGSTSGSAEFTVNLPDIVSLGIRHRFDPRWTVMGTVEWSNWSRIGTVNVNQLNGAAPRWSVPPPCRFPFNMMTAGFSRRAQNIDGPSA